MRRAATRAGCVVRSLTTGVTSAGERAIGRVDCPDGWAAARMLLASAQEDARTSGARELALALRRIAPSDEAFARAVQAYVKSRVRFEREIGEVFQNAEYTLATGVGDCDDHARVVYALAMAGGLPAVMAYLYHAPPADTQPTHAAAQLCPDRECRWAETTIDARFGEHPLEAAERLRLVNARQDLAREVRTMNERDLEAPTMGAVARYTADLSDGFFAKLKEIGKRQNFRPEHALAVMLFESGLRASSIHPTAPASGIFGRMFKTRAEAVAFSQLSAEDQLPEYERYMSAYRNIPKPGAQNLYQLNFLPASAIPGQANYRGTSDDAVLAAKGGRGYGGNEDLYYRSNTVLDRDGDGAITVGDLRAALEAAQHANAAKWAEALARLGEDAAPSSGPGGGVGTAIALVLFGVGVAAAAAKHWIG